MQWLVNFLRKRNYALKVEGTPWVFYFREEYIETDLVYRLSDGQVLILLPNTDTTRIYVSRKGRAEITITPSGVSRVAKYRYQKFVYLELPNKQGLIRYFHVGRPYTLLEAEVWIKPKEISSPYSWEKEILLPAGWEKKCFTAGEEIVKHLSRKPSKFLLENRVLHFLPERRIQRFFQKLTELPKYPEEREYLLWIARNCGQKALEVFIEKFGEELV